MICEMLFAYMIVGAVEITPGTMTVEQLVRYDETPIVKTILVPTKQYMECFEEQSISF